MLSGTEADIVNSITKLREATKNQIRREVGLSLEYIDFVCRCLVKKGYLRFTNGRYYLAKEGIETLPATEAPKIEKKLLEEVGGEIAEGIKGELKKTLKEIKMLVTHIRHKGKQIPEEKIEIKSDFGFPVEDESLTLESNINKIGPNLEKGKSDIDESVRLFKKFKKYLKKFKRGEEHE